MTPENVQRILTALRAGNTRKAAAGYGRIDQGTLENWMRRYADFRAQVELAERQGQPLRLGNRKFLRPHAERTGRGVVRRRLMSDAEAQRLIERATGCPVCGYVFDVQSPRMRSPVIDHDHVTGMVRGVLCSQCNMAIGMLSDDPALLARATAYLQAAGQTAETG